MNAAGIAVVGQEAALRDASDAQLVAYVRAGDHAAFAELYRRYQPAVARFVRARVRDHGRAEDVVQEAFVCALRRLRQTDSEIAFRAWIFEIARNASIDAYRRSSRAEEVSMDVAGGLALADASRLGGPAGPDVSLVRKESFDHFQGALEELSETHHRVIVMRELEGRSYREIGESMNLSQAAVESTLFRARRKLEHEYAQLDSGRRCRSIGALTGRLAEGLESERDRLRLDRHARRCSACRRQARQLGIEPLLGRHRRTLVRAAGFLPLPAFLRRRGGSDPGVSSGISQGVGQAGVTLGPTFEVAGGVAGKVAAVIAAAAMIGGGATLGGSGPLAVDGDSALPGQLQDDSRPEHGVPAEPRRSRMPAAAGAVSPAAPDRARGSGPAQLLTTPPAVLSPPRSRERPGAPPPQAPSHEAPSALPRVAGPGQGGSDAVAAGLSVPAQPVVQAPAAPQLDMGAPPVPAVSAIAPPPSPEGIDAVLAGSASGSAAA